MSTRALKKCFEADDLDGLRTAARPHPRRVLRFLVGRLYGEEKARAVRLLGELARDEELLPADQLVELMRRFFWALNDESGAVPFGIPEAIGELLAQRPQLQAEYLTMLCGLLTSEEMSQTGPIERGAVWALGRVGRPVAVRSPEGVEALQRLAADHPEPETRRAAEQALRQIHS